MVKSVEYRIYPTAGQEILIWKHFSASRFIYNQALECKKWLWNDYKQKISIYDIDKIINNEMKPMMPWLREVYSHSLKSSLLNLEKAYANFYKFNKNFPKFKSKKDRRQSYQYPVGTKIRNDSIYIPKIGWVLAIVSRRIPDGWKIGTTTVKKASSGKYFIVITVDDMNPYPSAECPTIDGTIGIDLGIKSFCAVSDGRYFEAPRFLRHSLSRIQNLSRKLARKRNGSKSKEKARIQLATAHEKIAHQRRDFIHKLSSSLVYDKQVNTICLENLNVSGMLKNHRMARSIIDSGWSEFTRQIEYKAKWSGRNVVYISRWFPSSKMCCNCGQINEDLKLKDREWICSCGVVHERDLNASINIKNEGFRSIISTAKE